MLVLQGHVDRVRRLAYAPDGETLASCGADGMVTLWELGSARARASQQVHHRYVYSVAFSPDGRTLASAVFGGGVILRDAETGRERHALRDHDGPVLSLAFAPHGRALAAGVGCRWDGPPEREVVVWDLDSPRRPMARARLPEIRGEPGIPAGPVGAVGEPPGHFLAWDPAPAGIRLGAFVPGQGRSLAWAPNFEQARDAGRPGAYIRCVAFAPDGRTLAATAGRDVLLWDWAARGPLAVLRGHRDLAWTLAFAPDGRTLATGGHDGTVRLWGVPAAKECACFDWGIGRVNAVAFAPDGMTIAAGGDGDIVVWDVPESS